MKSKKGIVVIVAVALVCTAGLILSQLVDWTVSARDAGGDIAKSSRFSRKTASESLTNMEELIANDEDYKKGITVACVVMQTRAAQFAALVDLSNEAAGDIPAFADVLKDMNAVRGMAEHVSAQLAVVGADLDAVLAGESRPDLTQNTINASLAYTNLQKQNKLADRFIATADQYLKEAEGDDRLKLVRDQWEEYQLVTAALAGDEDAEKKLADYSSYIQGYSDVDPTLSFSHGLASWVGKVIDQTCSAHFGFYNEKPK